jgi:protein gp37
MPSHDKLKYQNYFQGINWLIIGSQTQPVRHPPREWVDEIITAAYNANIPVFVKEPMASHFNIHRQEFPLTTPLEVK